MKTNLELLRAAIANPWSEYNSLQKRMERLFDEFSNSGSFPSRKSEVDFLPACDVVEKDNQYLISFDVPGIPKDKINVEVTGNTLTVSGKHSEEHHEEKGKRKMSERTVGEFERTLTLPGISNAEKIEAFCKDGVLKIYVPKLETNQTRKIQIGETKTSPGPQLTNKPQEAKSNRTQAA